MNRACFAFGALVLSSSTAFANPPDTYGMGSRSAGMGGAMTAEVSDGTANYYNPAGLLRTERFQIDLGYRYAHHALYANGRDNQVDAARGFWAGIAVPARVLNVPFAAGLVLYLPDERLARSRLLPQSQPRWELYDNRVQRFHFAANLAVAPVRWLRIGGGFSYVASVQGHLGIEGELSALSASEARLRHSLEAQVQSVFYPQAGLQVDVHRMLTFGLTYRGEYQFRLTLDTELGVTVVAGALSSPDAVRVPAAIAVRAAAVTQFLPQQAVLGASFRPLDALTIVADLTWVQWSRYRNPAAALSLTAQFALPPGLEGFPLPTIPPPFSPAQVRFSDTFVPRVGAEYRVRVRSVQVAFRGGYRFEASPVPEQTTDTNFLDADRHSVALGTGVLVHPWGVASMGLRLDLHGDASLLVPRVMRKDDPTDGVGDVFLTGSVWNVGASVGAVF